MNPALKYFLVALLLVEDLSPLALFNLKENRNEDESHNLVDNPDYSNRVQTMFARYQQLRAGGEPTVTGGDTRHDAPQIRKTRSSDRGIACMDEIVESWAPSP